ncbi:hypothetical protein SDC9_182980 [bioreactor metagenome]|uniref:Uncharacterized protein n=1 Tax=bioreactor metagenome TaxID=1076179 RepID=A0A645HAU4_9ZZZZ
MRRNFTQAEHRRASATRMHSEIGYEPGWPPADDRTRVGALWKPEGKDPECETGADRILAGERKKRLYI